MPVSSFGEGDRDPLEHVHALLHAAFHAGVNVRVAAFLIAVLDQHLKNGTAVLLDEGGRDQSGLLVGVRDAFERVGADEALIRDREDVDKCFRPGFPSFEVVRA